MNNLNKTNNDVIICGGDNIYCLEALKIVFQKAHLCCLLTHKPIEGGRVAEWCNIHNIPIKYELTPEEFGHVKLLVTFTYKKKVDMTLIDAADIAINFHPAPLPEYRGKGSTSLAILRGETRWAATCHYLTDKFDKGGIVEERWFDITDELKNGYDLSQYSWRVSLQMFEEMLERLLFGEKPEGRIPTETGNYFNLQYLAEQKKISLDETVAQINKKIDALWFPPFEGAFIEKDGCKFYLVNDRILQEISRFYEKYSNEKLM